MLNELPVFPHDAASCSILVHGDFVYVCTGNGVDQRDNRLPLPVVAEPDRAR